MEDPSALIEMLKSAGVPSGILLLATAGFIWMGRKLISTLEKLATDMFARVLDGQNDIIRKLSSLLDRIPPRP